MNRAMAPGTPVAPERAPADRSAKPPKPPARLWRWVIACVLVVGVLGGGGAWYYVSQRPRDESWIVLQGNIDVRQVNLAFKVDGRIETLAVDEGDPVKAGQVVATL